MRSRRIYAGAANNTVDAKDSLFSSVYCRLPAWHKCVYKDESTRTRSFQIDEHAIAFDFDGLNGSSCLPLRICAVRCTRRLLLDPRDPSEVVLSTELLLRLYPIPSLCRVRRDISARLRGSVLPYNCMADR